MSSFNEREFEFCFNAEFVRKNAPALIGTPIIPSQRMENVLGYDIQFRIQNGQFTKSLFLQHKVSSYAQQRRGKNAKIWNCYNGPYYRFPVARLDKTRQHNLLVDLALKGENVFYCAPLFIGFDNLQNHFVQDQVIDNSRFFDPKEMGKLSDFEQHHVSYDPTGVFGFFHSDPVKLRTAFRWSMIKEKAETRLVNLAYAQSLQNHLTNSIKTTFEAPPSIPEKVQLKGLVMIVSYMLRRYFSLEWLILP